MWEAKNNALWCCCVSPVKILLDSLRLVYTNKLVFCSIICFTIIPLSFLIFTLTLSTHTLRSKIYHLEAVARLAPTRYEARHVWHESRHEAVSLLRTRALFSFLCFPLSLAAAVAAVQATFSALQGKPTSVNSAVAAVKDNWKRPSVTAIFVYAILLAFAPVPRVLAAVFASPWSRFPVLVIGSGVEVYLMAVLSLGLVVSIAEERLGWEAIRVGSGLMQGRRLCGWVLSGLFVLVSGSINRRMEVLLDGQDPAADFVWSTAEVLSPTAVIGVWDKTVLICSYGLVVLLSYVMTTVFYCDSRKRHVIREPEADDDNEDCASL